MSGRPRLVHEGSPIIGDDDSGFSSSAVAASASWSDGHAQARTDYAQQQHVVGSNLASLASATANSTNTSKPYKLQTRLVVGEDTNDGDLDMMAMDEDEHDHNNHNQEGFRNSALGDYSTSSYYGSNGHVYHGHHHAQHQQHSMDHLTFASSSQQQNGQPHQQQHQHQHQYNGQPEAFGTNKFYNNGHSFEPPNPIHTTPSNLPPPIFHMPSPSTSPLVVLDAANIAYNYSETLKPCLQSQRRQPDPRGIRFAIEYFLKQNCRVQAVVPISWYQLKPRPADHYHLKNRTRGDSDAKMVTEEVEELRSLRQRGFLVACPPGDDDDAYALALARREDDRVLERCAMEQRADESMGMDDDDTTKHLPKSVLGGYVVSNDMFHDAMRRDERKQHHHQQPLNARPISLKSWLKNRRISYSFANVGTTSEVDGEIRLDFLPNPRNDLIDAIDACNRLKCQTR
eukprot:CAMPEP_0181095600 /NCGR_PEP_ID=MMETSP1071-20121207/10598_1 /TAXON_ID=35127 /ORGANISM="Thalassiosira sp., Strain NH16" /LENGTH=455 /DNA_ID=CAMNT_0023177977 /DNA_START=165 /DNA_END=1532 /DNA_ORIENTATION=+